MFHNSLPGKRYLKATNEYGGATKKNLRFEQTVIRLYSDCIVIIMLATLTTMVIVSTSNLTNSEGSQGDKEEITSLHITHRMLKSLNPVKQKY